MKRRDELNSPTRRWEALTDCDRGGEVPGRSEKQGGQCQPQPVEELPRHNVRAGQNGRLLKRRDSRMCSLHEAEDQLACAFNH